MQTTTNFGFKKIELKDSPPDITVLDANWDSIDTNLNRAIKFQKAGGTGTSITLTDIVLTDGYCVSFIVTTANNAAATTINGKSLYKPGGTAAPNLIAGKAVTVWYDATGGCFFIKASAEGDAVAANVLAGKKFSTDVDTGLTGIMTNNGAVAMTPGTADQIIPVGYHNGSGKVNGDVNLISANIKAGTSIFGVVGKNQVVDTTENSNPADAPNILSEKISYVNGVKVTGSMPLHNSGEKVSWSNANADVGVDIVPPAGYWDGNTWLYTSDVNLKPENIALNKSIFGVLGTAIVGAQVATGSTTVGSDTKLFECLMGNPSGTPYHYISVEGLGLSSTPNIILLNFNSTYFTGASLYMKEWMKTSDNNIVSGTDGVKSPLVEAGRFILPIGKGGSDTDIVGKTCKWMALYVPNLSL